MAAMAGMRSAGSRSGNEKRLGATAIVAFSTLDMDRRLENRISPQLEDLFPDFVVLRVVLQIVGSHRIDLRRSHFIHGFHFRMGGITSAAGVCRLAFLRF